MAAALVLANRGALGEAAQVLEHTGARAHAAVIRIEYAFSLTGSTQRLAMLREGCARNGGETEEGRALHIALARALLQQASMMEDSAPRRGLLMEAARAFETGGDGSRAGEIYQGLGLLHQAAKAYERAGDISALEYALGLIERKEQLATRLSEATAEIDEAMRNGHRRLARSLLLEHTQVDVSEESARNALSRRLTNLEAALPRRPYLELRWGPGTITRIHFREQFTVGRAPDAGLTVNGAALSREHVVFDVVASSSLGLPETGPGLSLCVTDLGSKAGSFWDGEPLLPGEPLRIDRPGELGLGFSAAVEVVPVRLGDIDGDGHDDSESHIGALVRPTGASRWSLFLPRGGPLVLAPDTRVGARLGLDPPFVYLEANADTRVRLGSRTLGQGSGLQLLIGDRLELRTAEGTPIGIEVLA